MGKAEEKEMCQNCEQDVPLSEYHDHRIACARSHFKCKECNGPVAKDNVEAHRLKAHSIKICDQCGIKIEAWKLNDHRTALCPNLLFACRYCDADTPASRLSDHEAQCGEQRGRVCPMCPTQEYDDLYGYSGDEEDEIEDEHLSKKRVYYEGERWISLKDWDTHQFRYHGLVVKPAPSPRARARTTAAASSIEQQQQTTRPQLQQQQQQEDTSDLLPCEFCEGLVPIFKLLEHQAACVNPSNVRGSSSIRNSTVSYHYQPATTSAFSAYTSYSSGLSRSSSSALLSSYNRSTNLSSSSRIAASSTNTDNSSSSRQLERSATTSNNLSSSSSSYSNSNRLLERSATTANFNDNSNSAASSVRASRRSEIENDETPLEKICNICNAPIPAERLERHQLTCVRRPESFIRGSSVSRTSSFRETRRSSSAYIHDQQQLIQQQNQQQLQPEEQQGGRYRRSSSVLRSQTFNDRSYSRRAESLSRQSSYSRYSAYTGAQYAVDYASASRRSTIYNGYSGFAMYSSITQGLDEISYGGRALSRRNSVTDLSAMSQRPRGQRASSVAPTSGGSNGAAAPGGSNSRGSNNGDDGLSLQTLLATFEATQKMHGKQGQVVHPLQLQQQKEQQQKHQQQSKPKAEPQPVPQPQHSTKAKKPTVEDSSKSEALKLPPTPKKKLSDSSVDSVDVKVEKAPQKQTTSAATNITRSNTTCSNDSNKSAKSGSGKPPKLHRRVSFTDKDPEVIQAKAGEEPKKPKRRSKTDAGGKERTKEEKERREERRQLRRRRRDKSEDVTQKRKSQPVGMELFEELNSKLKLVEAQRAREEEREREQSGKTSVVVVEQTEIEDEEETSVSERSTKSRDSYYTVKVRFEKEKKPHPQQKQQEHPTVTHKVDPNSFIKSIVNSSGGGDSQPSSSNSNKNDEVLKAKNKAENRSEEEVKVCTSNKKEAKAEQEEETKNEALTACQNYDDAEAGKIEVNENEVGPPKLKRSNSFYVDTEEIEERKKRGLPLPEILAPEYDESTKAYNGDEDDEDLEDRGAFGVDSSYTSAECSPQQRRQNLNRHNYQEVDGGAAGGVSGHPGDEISPASSGCYDEGFASAAEAENVRQQYQQAELRNKKTSNCTSKNSSKRNSLDITGKTVQNLANELVTECAKAYAIMESKLEKTRKLVSAGRKKSRSRTASSNLDQQQQEQPQCQQLQQQQQPL